jgi:4-carboxymuconolactone decarboxylase
MSITLPPPRLPELDPSTFSEDQKAIHDAIVSGPRGRVEGPLKVWMRSAGLADNAQRLGAFCRFGTSLEPRLSELAIMVTGRVWTAQFEWSVHRGFALKAGISEAVIEAIRTRQTPPFEHEDERVVHDFAQALHVHRKVPDALYAKSIEVLGETKVVELVGILGYYTLISMTINAFNVPLEGDQVAELE